MGTMQSSDTLFQEPGDFTSAPDGHASGGGPGPQGEISRPGTGKGAGSGQSSTTTPDAMNLFDHMMHSAEFMPHGECYLWATSLIALHAISDVLVVLAYCWIPVLLIHFVRRRMALRFHLMCIYSTMCIPAGGIKIEAIHQHQ